MKLFLSREVLVSYSTPCQSLIALLNDLGGGPGSIGGGGGDRQALLVGLWLCFLGKVTYTYFKGGGLYKNDWKTNETQSQKSGVEG